MRYLFFDIECCNGRDICEFGYVITDTSFNPLEQKVITINPENKFNLVGRKNQRDIYLFFPESKYFSSPKFNFYYEKIKELIEFPQQIIVGHAILNDAKFIRTACERYNLAPINFRFSDSQKMYKEFFGVNNDVSLENAGEMLEVDFPTYLHKSDEDSKLTMELVKSMCEKLKVTLSDLIEMCPTCSGGSKDFEISYDNPDGTSSKWIAAANSERSNVMKKERRVYFKKFLDRVSVQGEVVPSPLNGKSVCISTNYEAYHLKEMLEIVQRIVNRGGAYKQLASECDYFVPVRLCDEQGSERECSRLQAVNDAIANGSSIEILTFEALLQMLDLSVEELAALPSVEVPSPRHKAPAPKQQAEPQGLTVTLGELIAAQLRKQEEREKKKQGN